MQQVLFFAVSLFASIAGAICGIGGGVIIKPVLDAFGWESVSAVSFLSGCTVLCMSCYSVGKSMLAGEKKVDLKTGTPLAAGAAIGGVTGKYLFTFVKSLFADPNAVGAVQAVCLGIVTVGTLLYTLKQKQIHTWRVKSKLVCVTIGLVLGILSSFLGIGGGPINLVVLYYFFSMDTKTAAANSLYIILFSQTANLLLTLATRSVPDFQWGTLLLMVAGGILGGAAGRIINRRLDNGQVGRLFRGLLAVIIGVCVFNTLRYI